MSRVITVTSFKGGVGKTTVSANLAMTLAQLGHSVIAVDCDLESRCLDIALGLEDCTLFDICEVLSGSCKLEDAIVIDKRCEKLSFLSAPAYHSVTGEGGIYDFSDEAVDTFVENLKSRFEYIVFDFPARPDKLYRQLSAYSNYAFVVCLHTIASIRSAEKTAMALSELSQNELYDNSESGLSKRMKTRLIINCFYPKDVLTGLRPGILDIITKTSIKLIGVLPFDALMSASQEKSMLAYQVNNGNSPFYRAVKNLALRCTERNVPLMQGVKTGVAKSKLY